MSLMPTGRDKLRDAERAARSAEALTAAVATHAKQLEADNFALKARVLELEGRINTPHTDDWFDAVRLEAAHQQERWGSEHDAGKEPTDWFWLLGWLGGKAVAAAIKGDEEKAKHHTISSGAVLLNWFRQLASEARSPSMRPGIEEPRG
jgi:hypothetical protein